MNVLLIDDYELVAEGLIKRVKKVFPKATCIFVDNVRLAYAILHQQRIDLVICDLEFENEPQYDGFYIVEKILELEPRAKLIALSHYNSYRIMKRAKKAGFMSFLNKGCSFKDFSDTLKHVVKNGVYESQTEKKLIKKRISIARNIFSDSLLGISSLSKRELELTLLCSETTDRNVLAKKMNVGVFTIDSHFKNALSKLSLCNRKELAIFALDFMEELKRELVKKRVSS